MFKFNVYAQNVPASVLPRLCAAQALCLVTGLPSERYFTIVYNSSRDHGSHGRLWSCRHAGSDGITSDFNIKVLNEDDDLASFFSISIPTKAFVINSFTGILECIANGVHTNESDVSLRKRYLDRFESIIKFRESRTEFRQTDDVTTKFESLDSEIVPGRIEPDLMHPIIW